MYERAIVDGVWNDANAPVCNGGDLRLLLLLAGGINYPRPQVAR